MKKIFACIAMFIAVFALSGGTANAASTKVQITHNGDDVSVDRECDSATYGAYTMARCVWVRYDNYWTGSFTNNESLTSFRVAAALSCKKNGEYVRCAGINVNFHSRMNDSYGHKIAFSCGSLNVNSLCQYDGNNYMETQQFYWSLDSDPFFPAETRCADPWYASMYNTVIAVGGYSWQPPLIKTNDFKPCDTTD